MPPDAVYPMIKPYSQESLATVMADALVGEFSEPGTANIKIDNTLSDDQKKETKKIIADLIKKKVKVWRRVIGWTLNDCEPGKFFPNVLYVVLLANFFSIGHQMDIILKR